MKEIRLRIAVLFILMCSVYDTDFIFGKIFLFEI